MKDVGETGTSYERHSCEQEEGEQHIILDPEQIRIAQQDS